jgi:hypothetical protein
MNNRAYWFGEVFITIVPDNNSKHHNSFIQYRSLCKHALPWFRQLYNHFLLLLGFEKWNQVVRV